MQPLSSMDAGWFYGESPSMPFHVANLNPLSTDRCSSDVPRRVTSRWRGDHRVQRNARPAESTASAQHINRD